MCLFMDSTWNGGIFSMVKIVVTGNNILIGRLNGVILESACGIVFPQEGWALKSLFGADKHKFPDVSLQYPHSCKASYDPFWHE